MNRISRVRDGTPDGKGLELIKFVDDIIKTCRPYLLEQDTAMVVSGLSTALSVVMAGILFDKDKDEAMSSVRELMDDIKRATFAQMEALEEDKR